MLSGSRTVRCESWESGQYMLPVEAAVHLTPSAQVLFMTFGFLRGVIVYYERGLG